MTAETIDSPDAQAAEGSESELQGSNYEIIRARLDAQASELRKRTEALNTRRQALFGSTQMTVVGQDRIRTDNACIPQDIVPIGDWLLFGYNVQFGLKKTTTVADVFSLHHFEREGDGFEISSIADDNDGNFLGDREFVNHFNEIYTYYSGVRLHQLHRTENRLFAVLQLGDAADTRVLRWGIDGDQVGYLDNAGHLEHKLPPQHDFDWIATTRENHVRGKHPHVSILDEVFVETTEGDLTIKIEDNTQSGQGIYAEPVDDPRQSLNDAEYEYVAIGNLILMRILPYREKEWRYFAYNRLTRSVIRLDAIGQTCVQLPEQHGFIVPGGYVLGDGTAKRFETNVRGMALQNIIRSPNGEDVLYVYHRNRDSLYLLQSYNVIRKEVASPIPCHGYSIFDDGTMIVFRFAGDEPTRVHPMQIWQTPFCSDEHLASIPTNGSPLANLGNAELVKGISDAFSLCRMIADQKPSLAVYEALITSAQRTIDNYFWLAQDECGNLREVLEQIMKTSELVIDEFQKVQTLVAQAQDNLADAERRQREILRDVHYDDWTEIQRFVDSLSALRNQRGHLITLKETRYIDVERLDELEAAIVEQFDRLSRATVDFLLEGDALTAYLNSLTEVIEGAEKVENTMEATELRKKLDTINAGLQLLTEVVSGLQVDDPNKRTRMLENIGEILGQQNRARAMLQKKTTTLLEREGKAEFAVQFQLLSQTVTSALAMCDDPESCDDQLTRVMIQLEELESRFAAYDAFLADLTEKREEIYEVFESKKQTLLEDRQRKVHTIADAAGRVIAGIERRANSLKSVDELNAYFASDAMVMKVRDMASKLRGFGDDVRADDVETQLKSARDQAIRQLRDKLDLFEGGTNVIKFGRHRFSVNTQPAELTLLPRGDVISLHVTGTEFFEPVRDETFADTRPFWSQHLVSETADTYRGEYLAACILLNAESGDGLVTLDELFAMIEDDEAVLKLVRRAIEDRYDEGYERGVHDHDAAIILERITSLYRGAGLLRFSPDARALASAFCAFAHDEVRSILARRAQSLGRLRSTYHDGEPLRALAGELAGAIGSFSEANDLGDVLGATDDLAREAGRYLAEELVADSPRFTAGGEAHELLESFLAHTNHVGARSAFEDDVAQLDGSLTAVTRLVSDWLRGYVRQHGADREWEHAIHEAALLYLTRDRLDREVSSARTSAEAGNLLGQHPRIDGGTLRLRIDAFLGRLRRYRDEHVPAYRTYRARAHELLEQQRERLRLGELAPKVLSTFVRNRLIDEVYLPLIGDNLAKQLGAAGEEGRSDRSGLLLLISPPGYGKTTLMEYVASRLGLMFMKINGPSLGYDVVSLDPDQAPNATARQEVEKINFALEMGNNVMLYLDDIQHTNTELLQKFISLCDATRRIEGIWNGRTKTYDLRGKRFSVVMAGNPYTERGERFQIPDMLANRADTYNLGDILSGKEDAFEMSYVENSLTSNSVTAPLSTRDRKDIDLFARMARGEQVALSDFDHAYSTVDAQEIANVFQKMMRIRDIVLKVNANYIKSAAMQEDYRTEPPFQLQGSYRNMNKMVEKLASVMNDDEVDRLITNHYQQEAQTLTTGAEQNLLKFAELRGTLEDQQAARWKEIKAEFSRRKMFGGDDDPIARVAGPLASLVQKLGDVQTALSVSPMSHQLGEIRDALEAAAKHSKPNGLDSAGEAKALREAISALKDARLEVQVVGDLPGRLAETLDHQLAIIESALVPLARAVHSQLSERDDTQTVLREIMSKLDGIKSSPRNTPRGGSPRPPSPFEERPGATAPKLKPLLKPEAPPRDEVEPSEAQASPTVEFDLREVTRGGLPSLKDRAKPPAEFSDDEREWLRIGRAPKEDSDE